MKGDAVASADAGVEFRFRSKVRRMRVSERLVVDGTRSAAGGDVVVAVVTDKMRLSRIKSSSDSSSSACSLPSELLIGVGSMSTCSVVVVVVVSGVVIGENASAFET